MADPEKIFHIPKKQMFYKKEERGYGFL